MIDVELLGTHPDGNQLILNDAEGKRYCLAITSQLREILKEKPNLQLVAKIPRGQVLRPAQIQTLLRSGMSAQAIAEKYAVSLEKISLFEGPILAERNWKAEQMRAFQIGEAPDSPQLAEVVVDRLAARGVTTASIRWDAYREERSSWFLVLRFIQDAREYQATWEGNLSTRKLKAWDEEARWLSETPRVPNLDDSLEDYLTSPFADLASPHSPLSPSASAAPSESTVSPLEQPQGTDALLEALNQARGRRGAFDPSEFIDLEEEDDADIMEALFGSSEPGAGSETAGDTSARSETTSSTVSSGLEFSSDSQNQAIIDADDLADDLNAAPSLLPGNSIQAAPDSPISVKPTGLGGEVSALVAKVAAENQSDSQVTSLLDFKTRLQQKTQSRPAEADSEPASGANAALAETDLDLPAQRPHNEDSVDFGVHGLSQDDRYAPNQLTGELEDPITGAKQADIVANLQQKSPVTLVETHDSDQLLPGFTAEDSDSPSASEPQTQKRNSRRKSKRQSFPTWDEVVFGVKTPKK